MNLFLHITAKNITVIKTLTLCIMCNTVYICTCFCHCLATLYNLHINLHYSCIIRLINAAILWPLLFAVCHPISPFTIVFKYNSVLYFFSLSFFKLFLKGHCTNRVCTRLLPFSRFFPVGSVTGVDETVMESHHVM